MSADFEAVPGRSSQAFFLGGLEVVMLVILPQHSGGMKDAFVYAIIALVLVRRPAGIMSAGARRGEKI
ncbi:MAG: hypothetical protein OXI87_11170 [Albidovulum sp.]|nr:hypothetical protein [Albidovulum sp.]MDE0532293.1 hypothetical protein [Albidovulum sp.]